jgi:hypothetical protein
LVRLCLFLLLPVFMRNERRKYIAIQQQTDLGLSVFSPLIASFPFNSSVS